MATILCLETATTNCSVALSVNGSVVALEEVNEEKFAHAEKLHIFIENVLKKSGIQKNQLDAIAVSKGPGSYTGLRIGVSAAKGLCFALDVPLISIATLQSLAQQIKIVSGIIIPMLDARRMEVYSAVFSSEKKQLRETRAEILNENSFSEYSNEEKIYFIGDGAEKFKPLCSLKNAVFIDGLFPSAKEMGALAEVKNKISDIEDVAYFEPFYLKDFISG